MNEQQNRFNYTYSAAEQKEIEAIRQKYCQSATAQPDKITLLRQLDAQVTKKASAGALTLGVISALVMGTGMSLIMTDLGEQIGIASPILIGILVGVIGMLGVISAYPLYRRILIRERKKIAPQILQLSEELLQ